MEGVGAEGSVEELEGKPWDIEEAEGGGAEGFATGPEGKSLEGAEGVGAGGSATGPEGKSEDIEGVSSSVDCREK